MGPCVVLCCAPCVSCVVRVRTGSGSVVQILSSVVGFVPPVSARFLITLFVFVQIYVVFVNIFFVFSL